MSVYTAAIKWTFTAVDGELWSVTGEDCEFAVSGECGSNESGHAVRNQFSGEYQWEYPPLMIRQVADALLEFFNTYGTPWSPR